MNEDDTCLKLHSDFKQPKNHDSYPQAYTLDLDPPGPPLNQGLNDSEVAQRISQGLSNGPVNYTKKKVRHIIAKNTFSLFNLLHITVALALLYVKSYENLLFVGVVFFNTLIGVVQEVRAKRVLDKLSLSSVQTEMVVREGKIQAISSSNLVQDDIVILRSGSQVSADCVIKYGKVEVNESMVTGESDGLTKSEGETLLSGSFVTSDVCYAQVVNVGAQNSINKMTKNARQYKKYSSEMIDAVRMIIKWLSVVVVPLGLLLFWRQFSHHGNMMLAVERTSAAILSMIPEGLVLLTTVALAVGAMRLAKEKILIQELYGLETLSKIDVVCMDKTGTITENKIQVQNIKPLNDDFSLNKINQILSNLVSNLNDAENRTFCAIKNYIETLEIPPIEKNTADNIKFSSSRKWSGATFKNSGSFALGAPEVLLSANYFEFKNLVEELISDGNRVIALVAVPLGFFEAKIIGNVIPIAFIVLKDKIRANAKKMISLFQERDAQIKLLSGDNPLTVSLIAQKVGVSGCHNFVDAVTLKTQDDLKAAAQKYTVFGRLSPNQKQDLVRILKENQKVAMIGDGINDVLALKEADCSIALKDASPAAKRVSQIVLMDNDFSLISNVISEGQRIINNIQRSGAMFLSKSFFAVILTLILLFWHQNYPFEPLQLTLINSFTVGIPSFILSFQKSPEIVRGRFLTHIVENSLPSAIMMVANIVCVYTIASAINLTSQEISTLCVFAIAFINISLLYRISYPIDSRRRALIWVCATAFIATSFALRELFELQYTMKTVIILVLFCYASHRALAWLYSLVANLASRLGAKSK